MPDDVDETAKRMREAAVKTDRYGGGHWLTGHFDACSPENVLAILDDRDALTSLLEKAGEALAGLPLRATTAPDLERARSVLAEIEAYKTRR